MGGDTILRSLTARLSGGCFGMHHTFKINRTEQDCVYCAEVEVVSTRTPYTFFLLIKIVPER